MKISEVFATIQGEGILSGVPSLFIRVSGCNLRCVWCDTPYTSWTPEGAEWSVERILEWTSGFPQYRHVVLTGGEPMIFPESGILTRALRDRGFHITVETAGTVWQELACDLMSISPKLANSIPVTRDGGRWAAAHDRLRHNPVVLQALTSSYAYQLKFVVAEASDLAEVRLICGSVDAPPDRVLLMPEGVTPEALASKGHWLVEICKAEGYRFCPRLHVMLYGNRRGV